MNINTPFAAAAERNALPILGVLRYELAACAGVLEIGTGTAQQSVVFAAALPTLTWQTSDLQSMHGGIRARLRQARLANLHEPLSLDVCTATPATHYDAVYSSNTAHIMSLAAVECMFKYVSQALRCGGLFVLYGPFRVNGAFSTESNAAFDRSLRSQDATMGLRDLECLQQYAATGGLQLLRQYAMPANNLLLVWRKED